VGDYNIAPARGFSGQDKEALQQKYELRWLGPPRKAMISHI
jgi:hypothetical protein